MNFFNLFKRKYPKYIKNVWWNASVHMGKDQYPHVFDSNEKYIDCKEGKIVTMIENQTEKAMYKVVKMWRDRPGSDWLYSSDSIHCDVKFSHTVKNHENSQDHKHQRPL